MFKVCMSLIFARALSLYQSLALFLMSEAFQSTHTCWCSVHEPIPCNVPSAGAPPPPGRSHSPLPSDCWPLTSAPPPSERRAEAGGLRSGARVRYPREVLLGRGGHLVVPAARRPVRRQTLLHQHRHVVRRVYLRRWANYLWLSSGKFIPKRSWGREIRSNKIRLYLSGRRDVKADVMVGFGSGKFILKNMKWEWKIIDFQVSPASQMDQFWGVDNTSRLYHGRRIAMMSTRP